MKLEPSHTIHPLVLQLQKLFNRDLVEKYEFLKVQLEIAVENQDKRIRFTDQQRSRLVKFGTPVRKHLDELCKLMKPDTLLKWHREQKRKNVITPSGLKRKSEDHPSPRPRCRSS